MIVKYIKSDLYRYTGKISFKLFLKNYLFNRGFNFSVWLHSPAQNPFGQNLPIPFIITRKSNTALIFISPQRLAMACISVMVGHW